MTHLRTHPQSASPTIAMFDRIAGDIDTKRSSKRFKIITFADCSHAWSYLGKINIVARNIFNAAAASKPIVAFAGEGFPGKVKNVTTHMKLLAIVSVPFTMNDMHSSGQKLWNSLRIRDYEGSALTTLSLAIMSLDVVDSVTTFVNSALRIASAAPIGIFSAMGLPLGASMSSLGTVSRSISISKTIYLFAGIHMQKKKVYSDGDQKVLRDFLEKKLGVDEVQRLTKTLETDPQNAKNVKRINRMKARMKAAILRSSPQAAVKELEKLHELLTQNVGNSSPELTESINKSIAVVKSLLMKKMWVDALGIMANITSLTALTLFFIGNSTPVPYLLLALAFSIRIGAVAYQDLNKN